MGLSSRSESLPFISQSVGDYEQTLDKFLKALGMSILLSQKYPEIFILSVCYMDLTLSELGS